MIDRTRLHVALCRKAQHAAQDATSDAQQQAHELERLNSQVHFTARDLATRRDALKQATSALEATNAQLGDKQRESGQLDSAISDLKKVKVELEMACGLLRDEQSAAAAQKREFRDIAVQTAQVHAHVAEAASQAGAGLDRGVRLCRDVEVQCELASAWPALAPACATQSRGSSDASGSAHARTHGGARHAAAGQLKQDSVALDDEVASMQEAVAAAKCAICHCATF